MKSLTIVLPAYNEEFNVEKSVRKAVQIATEISTDFEVLIVNDGSKDQTGDIADRLAQEFPQVHVIHHNLNQGYGSTVWDGLINASKDLVFFTDCDLQFDLSEVKKLLEALGENDAAIGYRSPRADHLIRILNGKAWSFLNKTLFGLKNVRDIDCAFKLFKRSVFERIQPKSNGIMFSAEMMVLMQRAGMKWTQIPVKHLPRKAGHSACANLSATLCAFKELFKFWRESK